MKSIKIRCKTCKNFFSVSKSYYNNLVEKRGITPKYCSKKCYGLSQRIKKNEDKSTIKKCIYYYVDEKKSLKEIDNLLNCNSKKLLVENNVKIRNKYWKISTICNITKITGTHSEETKKKLRNIANRIYKERPEIKNILRERTLQQLKDGRMPKTNTSIEKKMSSILVDLKQYFYHNYPFGFWSYDFYLPNNKLFIECDGDYWHGYGLSYNKMNKTQKNNYNRGKNKEKYVLKRGYTFVRFWEHDINNEEIIKQEIKKILI